MAKKKEQPIEEVLKMGIKPRKKSKEAEVAPFDAEKFDELLKKALEFNPKEKKHKK